MFLKYPKIHRLGKEETNGILDGYCVVQEKVDGANASIWCEIIDGEKHLCLGSRNRCLCKFPLDPDKRPSELTGDGFRGFREYVAGHEGICEFFKQDKLGVRMYGEWLVPHTIKYKEDKYNHFYLFDIVTGFEEIGNGDIVPKEWLESHSVTILAISFAIQYPEVFMSGVDLNPEEVEKLVGKTEIGDIGEGVVIKNNEFVNKFGNRCYAKIVSDNFKEENAIAFGGNNKHSASYWEMYVCNKYITKSRVEKIMNKILMTLTDNEQLEKKHTPRVASTVYNDMLTEEIWEIQKNVPRLEFNTLKRVCTRKAIKIFHDILDGHDSVAYEE